MSINSGSGLELDDVSIRFGDVTAVRSADMTIESGEFFTLLGPSGCGKTTLLRAIAGFYRHSAGTIRLAGEVIDDLPAHRRDTGMVFQNYAVFPHLNVWDNVAYGLKTRGVTGAEAETRIRETLAMVDLTGYEQRMPKELSGGQQQRVVIARAVVIRPRVLLMDEPLANLDAKLRVRLRNDLKELQRKLGITTVYVTHDQEEALSLSDRIAVMSGGEVLQVGTPEQIYTEPAAMKVAEFIGEGNFVRGTASAAPEGTVVELAGGTRLLASGSGSQNTGDVWIGFRPQDVRLGTAVAPAENAMLGTVVGQMYLGSYVRLEIEAGLGRTVSAQLNAADVPAGVGEGSRVSVSLAPSQIMVFPGTDEDVEL